MAEQPTGLRRDRDAPLRRVSDYPVVPTLLLSRASYAMRAELSRLLDL